MESSASPCRQLFSTERQKRKAVIAPWCRTRRGCRRPGRHRHPADKQPRDEQRRLRQESPSERLQHMPTVRHGSPSIQAHASPASGRGDSRLTTSDPCGLLAAEVPRGGRAWKVDGRLGARRLGCPSRRREIQQEAETLLAQVPLFRGLSRRQLGRVAAVAEHKHCLANSALVRVGTPGDAVYVILDGEAQVELPGGPSLSVRAPSSARWRSSMARRVPRPCLQSPTSWCS